MSSRSGSEVQKFYQGSEVFVSGGTGFLGKLTIEKILRSCPDVKKVYALVRPKKGLSVEERKNIILDNVVFDRLKNERPGSLEKVVFVSGDCSAPRLGLSDSDYQELTQHVSIVLHLAATVRFDEMMKVAINVNVKGAMEVLKLCRQCSSLKAAVFVTTSFSNPSVPVMKEEFYNPPMNLEEILALVDRVTDQELEILSHKVTGPWALPYLFSKAVIEDMLLTQAKDLPIAIVRPSMVICTASEPVPGWLDNVYGPISIVIGASTGVLRVNNADEDLVLDVVPADLVSNCIVAVASTMATRENDVIAIYNVATSDKNPLTIRNTKKYLLKLQHYPVKTLIWHPFLISVANFKLYTFLSFFLHVLPGCLLDFALRLKGHQPMLMKIYRKVRKYVVLLHRLPRKDMIVVSDNTLSLHEELNSEDKELFFFDTSQVHWEKLMKTACLETRKHILNETLDDLKVARSRARKFYIAHTVLKYLLCGLAIWTTWHVIHVFYERQIMIQ